ncbi:hypothetical protein [Nocardia jiangsuensis]|uniref:Uncharacterized protein n=1 Tax=Nocardia jiangsuensis TaxID=1691563 RepID=A0ABV8DZ85_9NOCA
MSRVLGFGVVARAYERVRPEYPPDLAEHRRTLSAHDYLGHLGTLSAALPARVEIIADITAHLA